MSISAKKLLLRLITDALSAVPVPPLLVIVADYAEFVGIIETAARTDSDIRAIAPRFDIGTGKSMPLLVVGGRTDLLAFTTDGPPVSIRRDDFTDGFIYSVYDICRNPVDPTVYYIGTASCILKATDNGRQIRSFAGNRGYFKSFDGPVDDATFNFCSGIICSSDGRRLYVCESAGCRIRAVDLQTNTVSTIDQTIGQPAKLTFYTGPTVPTDSVIFITAADGIRRLDIQTGRLTVVLQDIDWNPHCIACTSRGCLIVTDQSSTNLYLVDPILSRAESMAYDGDGSASAMPFGNMYLDESARSVWLVQDRQLLRRLTVCPSLFYG